MKKTIQIYLVADINTISDYLPKYGNYVKNGNNVQLGNTVTIEWNVWSRTDLWLSSI